MSPIVLATIAFAGMAGAILLWFLIKKPTLVRGTKLALLLGFGIFPIATAGSANVQGFEATTERQFCGSCHVMTPYQKDSEDPKSIGLASRHARNPYFGDRNCYICHADYGMYGTVLTKMGGMRHVWLYYTEFHDMPLAEAKEKIHIRRPFPNSTCMQCHSTELQGWQRTKEHRTALPDVVSGKVSCASAGCHNYGHPFSKPDGNKTPAELAP